MLDSHLLSEEALGRVRLVCEETNEKVDAVAARLGLVSEAAMAKMFAGATGLPVIDAADLPPAPVAEVALSPAFLHDMRVLPIGADAEAVTIAQANPLDDFAIEAMRFAFGRPVKRVIALPSDIDAAIERLLWRDGRGRRGAATSSTPTMSSA